MIEHAWSILCTKSITDPESRNVTLVEVIENVQYPSNAPLPAVAPVTTDFVTCWYRARPEQPARGTGRITLMRPNGTQAGVTEYAIDLTVFVLVHAVVRSGGMEIVGPGVHFFKVELKLDGQEAWTIAARIPLQVTPVEIANPVAVPAQR